MTKSSDKATIAIPSKGRLKQQVLNFLKSKGYPVVEPKGRQLHTFIEGKSYLKVVYLHAKDIALLLHEGAVDIGFTGLDLIAETKAQIRPVARIGDCKVKLCILVSRDSPSYHPSHLLDKTVATSFPNIAQTYFDRLNIRVKIRPIQGASEGIPGLGIADGLVEIVESGNSAMDNNLKVIADDLFESECVCAVNKPEFQANYAIINSFLLDLGRMGFIRPCIP
jgi:ATP phosphoribosyltransferase